jgi:hypothetical protein
MVSLADFVNTNPRPTFQPKPFYSSEGDTLTFYFKDEAAHRERVDDLLTIYRSEHEEMVGCQIKGVRAILKQLGDFGVQIIDGNVDLRVFFMAYKLAADNPPRETIDELWRAASETKARVEAPELLSVF